MVYKAVNAIAKIGNGKLRESILRPQLRTLRLNEFQQRLVADDVRQRVDSVLRHWHDEAYRRTVLAPGLEEATFYKPLSADLEIRALVVVAVRNSLIEDLAASRPAAAKLKLPRPVLTDSQMPSITGAAIKFFQKIDLGKLEPVLQSPDEPDIFGTLPAQYPHAWSVLTRIGNSTALEVRFDQAKGRAPELPTAQSTVDEIRSTVVSVVSSGIDPTFDSRLLRYLDSIAKGEVPFFFSDSFKGITRNPDKLFCILNYVLAHGAAVVTHNYYLSPAFVSRRRRLLRPFHFQDEMFQKLSNQKGLGKLHKQALEFIKENL